MNDTTGCLTIDEKGTYSVFWNLNFLPEIDPYPRSFRLLFQFFLFCIYFSDPFCDVFPVVVILYLYNFFEYVTHTLRFMLIRKGIHAI